MMYAGCTLSTEGTNVGGYMEPDGGATTGGGGGDDSAPKCTVRADCSKLDTGCTTNECVEGKCVPTLAPDGSEAPGNAAGDCQKVICIAGKPSTQNDNTDVIPDSNVCTIESCNGGTKIHTLAENGTECGMPGEDLECKEGQCVGCDGSADKCPPSTDCVKWSCVNDICQSEILEGKEISDIDPDDCKHDVCSKDGVVVAAPNAIENGLECAPAAGLCFKASTCASGVCTPQFQAKDMKVADDGIPGNCLATVCDGMGVAVPGPDDADAPNDPVNDCEKVGCMNGEVTKAKEADGHDCGSPNGFDVCCNGACCASIGMQACVSNACCMTGKACNTTCCPTATDQCVGDACCAAEKTCAGGTKCCGATETCKADDSGCI